MTIGNACLTIKGAVTVGVNDTGHDVKFFGAAAGAYMLYDQSCDQLEIRGASADATTSTGKLLLSTSLTNVNANDVIGSINFQAPAEAGGTDAIAIAAGIRAVAQATFTCAVNSTDLIFYTGHSEAATEKFRFTSQGEIGIGGANYGTDGQVLTSTGGGTAVAWEDASGGLCSNADAIIHNCYGIVIGHTGVLASADHPANTVGEFTMIGAAGGDTGVHIIRHSADAGGGAIRFAKSRNATVASHTKVNSGDTLGEISWFGCDGGDFQPFAATIKVLVDGSPCTNDMPGRMEFSTTKDGAESPTLAMNIASTQEITVHSLKSGSSATTSVQSGLAKAWIVNVADVSGGSGCGLDSYNVSVSECATGVRLYTFGTDFGSANYVAVGSAGAPAGCNLQAPIFGQNTRTAGSICMLSRSSGGGNVDVISFNAFFGDQ